MLRIVLPDLMGYMPFFAARAMGWLPDKVATLIGPVSAEDRDRLFAAGEVDCMPVSLQSFVRRSVLREMGRIVAPLFGVRRDTSGVDRVLVGPSVRTERDLLGATIAYPPGGLEQFYFAYFIRHLGGAWPSPAKRVEVASREEMTTRFRLGDVDAIVTYRNRLDVEGGAGAARFLGGLPYSAPVFISCLVASAEAIAQSPDLISSVIDAYGRSVRQLRAAARPFLPSVPRELQEVCRTVYGRQCSTVLQELSGYRFFDADECRALMMDRSKPSMAARIQTIAEVWHTTGHDLGEFGIADLYTSVP